MKRRSTVLMIIGLLTAAGAGAGGYLWHRGAEQRQVVVAGLPPLPDLKDASLVLQERLAESDALARAGSVAGLAELATVYHANGYFTESLRCYETLEVLQPSEPKWLHRHATILAGYGEVDPAAELWQRTVELAPDYIPARLRLADAYLKGNRRADAARVYQEALVRERDNAYALLGLARVDYEENHLESARTRLEAVVNATKAQLGYDLIVTVYEKLGQKAKAEAMRASYGRASGAFRDPVDPWIDVLLDDCYDTYRIALGAGAARHHGDFPRAVQMLERALQLAPNDLSARYQLARMYREHGDFEPARDRFQQCTVLAPDFSDGWIGLGDLLNSAGDAAGAERILLAGIGHCPDSPGLRLQHARQLLKAGREAEAISEYQESIKLRPNEPEAYIELAKTYIQLGKPELGVEQLRKGLETDPAHPFILTALAFNAIASGTQKEADQWLARAVIQPRVERAQLDQLADAYQRAFGRQWTH